MSGPHGRADEDPLRTRHPSPRARLDSRTFGRDAWTTFNQPRDSYLTTQDMAERLSKWVRERALDTPQPSYSTVAKWCKRDWFGPLPEGRSGRGLGWRIPLSYEPVGRLWLQTKDPDVRTTGLRTLIEEPDESKPWLVVVAKVGSTHYTVSDVMTRLYNVLGIGQAFTEPAHVFYLGDEKYTRIGNRSGLEALD